MLSIFSPRSILAFALARDRRLKLLTTISSVIGIAILGAWSCADAPVQAAETPTFEVASVRRVDKDSQFRAFQRGGPGTSDPGRFTYANNLRNLLYYVFDEQVYLITAPDWQTSEYYTISANVPPGTTKEQFNLMLQNLLAERFHMIAHHEVKELPGYEMVVGRSDPRLRRSSEADTVLAEEPLSGPLLSDTKDARGYPQLARPGLTVLATRIVSHIPVIHLTARARTLSELAKFLSGAFASPIIDKTGLNGRYDFEFDYADEGQIPKNGSRDSDLMDASLQRIPDALQVQLGLKLKPSKLPLDTLVVDKIDKIPTEN